MLKVYRYPTDQIILKGKLCSKENEENTYYNNLNQEKQTLHGEI
jgi:hypothetical protein